MLPRRLTKSHNYANLNKRGFSSARSGRTRRAVKSKIPNSAPATPEAKQSKKLSKKKGKNKVNDNFDVMLQAEEVSNNMSNDRSNFESVLANLLNENVSILNNHAQSDCENTSQEETIDVSNQLESTGEDAINSSDDIITVNAVNASNKRKANKFKGKTNKKGHSSNIVVSEMDATELQGLTTAEKKEKLLANIALLEKQVKEQEEDAELRELIKRQEELQRKLSTGATPPPPRPQKRVKNQVSIKVVTKCYQK